MQASKYSAQGKMVWQAGNSRAIGSEQRGYDYQVRDSVKSNWRDAMVTDSTKRKLVEKVEAAIK